MGKASRKKKEARLARADTPDVRLADGRCLHCGGPKAPHLTWCADCSHQGRRRAQFQQWPAYKGPDFTEDEVRNLMSLTRDRRWAWGVPADLSYYEDSTPTQGQPEESA